MGAGAGVPRAESGEAPSSKIGEARAYFSNDILMRGFWAPIDQDGGGSITLLALKNYLKNTNPENVVALYAGPFLGPFATSAFCMKEAYTTSTGRTAHDDLEHLVVHEPEFRNLLKHLFFYHNLYSIFGEKAKASEPMDFDSFMEAIEELSDESMMESDIRKNYEKLGPNPTFGVYVTTMASKMLADDAMVPLKQAHLIEERMAVIMSHPLSALTLIHPF
jgi:hypothetical protein